MTKHKPTEEESMLMEEAAKKGEPAPTKRKTTTEAVQFKPVILITPSDEHALAYVQKYPNAIKGSTTLMARYASYGPKTNAAVDALVKAPIPPQATDAAGTPIPSSSSQPLRHTDVAAALVPPLNVAAAAQVPPGGTHTPPPPAAHFTTHSNPQ